MTFPSPALFPSPYPSTPLTGVEANISGFAEAQQRLRARFGEMVVFLQAPTFTYPAGTAIDPETSAPYDPVTQPTSSAQVSASATCNVAFEAYRAGRDRDDTAGAAGFRDRTHAMLIADISDRSRCEGAVDVVFREATWQVVDQKIDGIGAIQRWLTYVRRR